MSPTLLIVIPDFHNFARNTSLEILKDAFILPGSDWVIMRGNGFMMILYMARIKMRIIELCIC